MKKDIIRKIQSSAKLIDEPENYFKGISSDIPSIAPDEIIMLYRWCDRKMKDISAGLYHRRYVLTLNLATDGMACINERTILFKQGTALLIYPFQFHNYMVDMETFEWLVITFESNGTVPLELMNRTVNLSEEVYQIADLMLKSFIEVQKEDNKTAKQKLKVLLECLLLELLNQSGKNIGEETISLKSQKADLIERINGYIHANFNRPDLTLDEIAEAHNISKGYLCVLFKKMTGQGPGEYIRSIRINHALKLLNSGSYLISEIAEMAGYSSPAIFSRSFRSNLGISPREYQNSNK